MPKSKRDKKVSLTKTAKHGMAWKKNLVQEVKNAATDATSIYLLEFIGMKTSGLTELRKKWRDTSRIYLGKTKILQLALGKDEDSEVQENLHKLSNRIKGNCGLLLTSEPEEKVVKYFENFVQLDYAKSGNVALETVILDEGKLTQFPHSIEPHLRSLGLPTQLQAGIVTLVKETVVCKQGQILNATQAKILKLLEKPMAEFRVVLDCKWEKPDDFKVYPRPEVEEDEGLELDEDNDMDEEIEEVDEDDSDGSD